MEGIKSERWLRLVRAGLMILIPLAIFDYVVSEVVSTFLTYTVCGLLASVGLVTGAILFKPARPLGWHLIALGNFSFVFGDILYTKMDAWGTLTYPGIPDIFYLAGYPVMAVGLAVLARGRSAGRGNVIDALIISTSAALAAWVFLMRPYATDASMSLGAKIVSVAYPMGDLVLLSVVLWFVIGSRRLGSSLSWLVASVGGLLITDIVYGITSLAGTYDGGWVDAGYIFSYLAMALAGLYPSMRSVGQEDEKSSPRMSRKRLVFIGISGLIGPTLMITSVDDATTTSLDLKMVAMGTFVLFLLALMRVGGLVRAVDRNADELSRQRTELADLVEKLRRLESERRDLLHMVMQASERERTMLAVDLHDGPIQQLTAIGFELELAQLDLESDDSESCLTKLDEVVARFNDQIGTLRELMVSLRPPALDERGLASALADLARDFERESGVPCQVAATPVSADGEIETLLYRITQEALMNVRKHANASTSRVHLEEVNGSVLLEIEDDGDGFEPDRPSEAAKAGHIGLASIRERTELAGGTWSVSAKVGQGTVVQIRVPTSVKLARGMPEGESDALVTR